MDKMFEFEHNGHIVKVFHDCEYETRDFYAYDTDEETREAENEELSKLESGEYVACGFIAYDPCPTCAHLRDFDSCWGIVVDNNEDAIKACVLDCMG